MIPQVKPNALGTMAGHSQITIPFKGPIAKCNHYYEEMLIEDIPIAELTDDFEKAYKVRDDWNKQKQKNNDN